eukprot:8985139-Pyramimonas_sp.AAC.1
MEATGVKAEAGACPFSAAKNMISSLTPKVTQTDLADADAVEYPGPGKNPIQNLLDVMYIGVFGMEKATLHFAKRYGPISRCAATLCSRSHSSELSLWKQWISARLIVV